MCLDKQKAIQGQMYITPPCVQDVLDNKAVWFRAESAQFQQKTLAQRSPLSPGRFLIILSSLLESKLCDDVKGNTGARKWRHNRETSQMQLLIVPFNSCLNVIR